MNNYLLFLISFFSGSTLMSIELLFPRISAIWFGNILNVWGINFAMSLLVIAFGYKLGAKILSKNYDCKKTLLLIYGFVALFLFVFPFFYDEVLDSLIVINENVGSILFSLILMFPTIGLLAISSPLVIAISKTNVNTSKIFFLSTLGGTISILYTGLYLIPYQGIIRTFTILAFLMIINVTLLYFIKIPTEK